MSTMKSTTPFLVKRGHTVAFPHDLVHVPCGAAQITFVIRVRSYFFRNGVVRRVT